MPLPAAVTDDAELGTTGCVRRSHSHADDPASRVLRQFAEGDLGEAIAALRSSESHPDARYWAAWSLGRVPDTANLPLLSETAASDPVSAVRIAAAKSLARFGVQAQPSLVELMPAADRDVQIIVLDALASLGEARAVEQLEQFRASGDRNERRWAAKALRRYDRQTGSRFRLRRGR